MASGGEGYGCAFVFPFLLSPTPSRLLPIRNFLAAFQILEGHAGAERERGACNLPPHPGQRTGKTDGMYAAIVYMGCT